MVIVVGWGQHKFQFCQIDLNCFLFVQFVRVDLGYHCHGFGQSRHTLTVGKVRGGILYIHQWQ